MILLWNAQRSCCPLRRQRSLSASGMKLRRRYSILHWGDAIAQRNAATAAIRAAAGAGNERTLRIQRSRRQDGVCRLAPSMSAARPLAEPVGLPGSKAMITIREIACAPRDGGRRMRRDGPCACLYPPVARQGSSLLVPPRSALPRGHASAACERPADGISRAAARHAHPRPASDDAHL